MASITEALKTDIVHRSDLKRAANGDLALISGLENLRNALFHRLVTVPGSLVHRPAYGVGIGLYQNAPSTFSVQQKLALLIREQFLKDPRVAKISGISFQSDDSTPAMLTISMSITPVGYSELAMQFRPFGEGL